MFVGKAAFEKLIKLSQDRAVEIAKLQEMLGVLAQSQGMQFEFVIGEGYRLTKITPEQTLFVEHKRKSVARK